MCRARIRCLPRPPEDAITSRCRVTALRLRHLLVLGVALVSCTPPAPKLPPAAPGLAPASHDDEWTASLAPASPESVGVEPAKLALLAEWVLQATDVPIFSILVSRKGKLVFELYTSKLDRDDAHYVMSATKSFTSCLVGIAIDRGLLAGPEESVADALPRDLFASDGERERFRGVTLKDVLAMSALDAQVPPHELGPEARARQRAFLASDNRVRFALTQRLLPEPGVSFQYTDVTPLIAIGAVEYAARESGFEFAKEALFGPLGFRNEEWMHSDESGTDNGAYGLRVRPIDMQKLGLLYLNRGSWNGRRVVSEKWIDTSFTPWIRSKDTLRTPNYGWYWWARRFGASTAHVANGWKGQRIAVVPDRELVVTMTGAIEPNAREDEVFRHVMEDFVVPALAPGPLPPQPEADARLAADLRDVNDKAMRVGGGMEARMIPSREPKERHRTFSAGR